MCGIEWTAGNVALLAWALVALFIGGWCWVAIVKAAWWNFTEHRSLSSQIEKAEAPPMPFVRRPYDGQNGNGYQPDKGQDRPVNPPPRSP